MNEQIKKYAKDKKVRMYMIAKYSGVCESRFCIKLREKLTPEQELKIINIIDSLSTETEIKCENIFEVTKNVITDEEETKRFKYYNEKRTDCEMASLLGITKSSVCSWRNGRGLEANSRALKRHIYGYEEDVETKNKLYYET